MSGRLDGRVAVITGGASGLGAATARRIVRDGARVVLADRNPDALATMAAELGDVCATEVVDVTSEPDVERMVARALTEFGGLDIGVNGAGFGTFGLVPDHPLDEWRAVVDTCLTGVFLSLKHEAAAMRARGSGVIVNIASINSRAPAVGMAAYCSAKAGVEMLTRVAAMELGPHGVRVTGIGPGFIETPLTAVATAVPQLHDAYVESIPMGRAGQPDDIADAIAFLVSDDARWVSGDTLFVDGAELTNGYPDLTRLG
jgi:NAD(P)-dependent dehydrogenase (short-subunit alcohol dehydrogenase family)